MPRGDGTGPMGQGPRTGRRLGYCSGFNTPGFVTQGVGFGRGLGRGFRNFTSAAAPRELTKTEEKKILEASLESLKQEMKEIEQRLKEFK